MKLYGILIALTLLHFATACEKSTDDDGLFFEPEDYARCAHVDRESAMGQWLHSVCLANPWPTELPPATQEGLSTFGCWINDTLAFVAGDPRELPRRVAYVNHLASTGGGGDIVAKRDNYASIGNQSIYIYISFGQHDQNLFLTEFSRLRIYNAGELSGEYKILMEKSSLHFDKFSSGIAAGKFELTFYRPNSTDTLRLTDGRFDVRVTSF